MAREAAEIITSKQHADKHTHVCSYANGTRFPLVKISLETSVFQPTTKGVRLRGRDTPHPPGGERRVTEGGSGRGGGPEDGLERGERRLERVRGG